MEQTILLHLNPNGFRRKGLSRSRHDCFSVLTIGGNQSGEVAQLSLRMTSFMPCVIAPWMGLSYPHAEWLQSLYNAFLGR